MSYPHLSKAPITEALLDVRAEFAGGLERLGPFVEAVRGEFPDANPIQQLGAEFSVGGEQPSVTPSPAQVVGQICWNKARTRAVQARLDGFTVNHVKSYQSWDCLRDQSKQLWAQYVALVQPTRVVRCTLRFINRIELGGSGDLTSVLRTYPELSPELPQVVEQFFMRVAIPFPSGRVGVIVESVQEEPSGDLALGLDIQAVVQREFSPESEELWSEFDELRSIKNKCFFESLKQSKWEGYL